MRCGATRATTRELTRVLAMSVARPGHSRPAGAGASANALGLELPLLTYFVFIPIIVLDHADAGHGQRPRDHAVAFARAGCCGGRRAQVFALSVLFLALGVVGTLPGGVLYAFGEIPPSAAGRSPQNGRSMVRATDCTDHTDVLLDDRAQPAGSTWWCTAWR